MRKTRIERSLISVAAAFGVLAMVAAPAAASDAYAKKEGLACTSCHDKPGSKLLTDRGKYYELMGSLDGLDQLAGRFARCTSCHVRKPGSTKLTKVGKRYQWMVGDMEDLREWLMTQHPTEGEEAGPAPVDAVDDNGGEAAGRNQTSDPQEDGRQRGVLRLPTGRASTGFPLARKRRTLFRRLSGQGEPSDLVSKSNSRPAVKARERAGDSARAR